MLIRNLASATVMALGLCCAVTAQPRCSMNDLVGVWAYQASGWVVPSGESTTAPISMLGIGSIDHNGNFTGPGTVTTGAAIAGIPAGTPLEFDMINATVQVNADCTGLIRYYVQLKGVPVPPVGPYIDRLVVIPNQDEVLALGVVSPLSKPAWIYTMKRISRVPSAVSWPALPAQ
jgi:hypothetical protein